MRDDGGAVNAAVFVAHPGHELMIYNWIERHKPLYCCLTDGSGGNAGSRVPSTASLLATVGGRPGTIFGRHSDKTVYRLLLDGRVDEFTALAKELADQLIAGNIDIVAGDAVEGFNPVHDIWRVLIDGAVAVAERQTGRTIRNYDFALDSGPASCPESLRHVALTTTLDEAALDRKLTAALAYPEMRYEVEAALGRFGREAFAVECLRPSSTHTVIAEFEQDLPNYERFGQIRVEEGRYADVIRYRDHVLPVIDAIAQMAT